MSHSRRRIEGILYLLGMLVGALVAIMGAFEVVFNTFAVSTGTIFSAISAFIFIERLR
jgi:hypothetical protein